MNNWYHMCMGKMKVRHLGQRIEKECEKYGSGIGVEGFIIWLSVIEEGW